MKTIDDIIKRHNINRNLLVKNNLKPKDIYKLDYLYNKLNYIFKISESLEEVKDKLPKKLYKKEANKIGKEVEKLEDKLQETWKFEKNPLYYTYWYKIPGCSCPKMDNEENKGEVRIIDYNCPYHKFFSKEEK